MELDQQTEGAWIVHHMNKLQGVTGGANIEYDNTSIAGKAGVLLSALSSDDGHTLSMDKVQVLARAANISSLELRSLLDILHKDRLIEVSSSETEVNILGITSASVLQHTSSIFSGLNPPAIEKAAIDLAEASSIKPIVFNDISEELGDNYKLSASQLQTVFRSSTQIGFVDSERLDPQTTILFNGNLFRRGEIQKTKRIIDTLTSSESNNLNEVLTKLAQSSCLSYDSVEGVLGKKLFDKILSVGLLDCNFVANASGKTGFITKPAAFSKYSSSMIEDAFDLAKAFLSSVTYGITMSPHSRGKIRMVEALLKTLISGQPVGPVNAIAHDYKILEFKGVVRVDKRGKKNGRTGPLLYLLKKEIGELVLQAIQQGDVSTNSLQNLPSSSVTNYMGPEANREVIRKKTIEANNGAINNMLDVLRTGGF